MHRHLTRDDRCTLEGLLKAGLSHKDCADVLGVHPSTITRERRRCRNRSYDGKRAHRDARKKRTSSKHHYRRIEHDAVLEAYIKERLAKRWSPDQIAKTWSLEHGSPLSHQTIYAWMGRHPSLKQHLRHRGKKRRKYGMATIPSPFAATKRSITERPAIVATRSRIGDWEGDTILGKGRKQRILTHVDRMSMYLVADKLDVVTADDVVEKTEARFSLLPCRTITYDNGSEFALHRMIEQKTQSRVYFAHAGRPSERGSNENTNMLLRDFFPKGTSLARVTQRDVDRAVSLLNHRPRRSLGYLTPHEVFTGSIAFQTGG